MKTGDIVCCESKLLGKQVFDDTNDAPWCFVCTLAPFELATVLAQKATFKFSKDHGYNVFITWYFVFLPRKSQYGWVTEFGLLKL